MQCRGGGTIVVSISTQTLKHATVDAYLNEELGVERAGGRVEWRTSNVGVDFVLSRDGVCGEQVDKLDRGEASVLHTGKDLFSGVSGLGYKAVGRCTGVVRATSHELETRATEAVGGTDGTSKVDAIA